MHSNFSSKVSTKLSSIVLSALVCSFSAIGIEQEEKIAELLPVSPIGIADSGNVISRLVSFEDVFSWDRVTGKQSTVHSMGTKGAFNPFGGGTTTSVEMTADGSLMAVYEYADQAYQIRVIELAKPGFPSTSIRETRALNAVPRFSPEGDRYAFAGRIDQNAFGIDGLWSFNLSEFMVDAAQGSAQPTGFYMDTIHEPGTQQQVPPFRIAGSGDRIGALAWAQNGNELAYHVTDGKTFKTSLMVYDFTTRKAEAVTALQPVQRMEWPQGDFIYYVSGFGASAGLFRIDRVKKTSESVIADPVEPSSMCITRDGRWLTYSAGGAVGASPILYDLLNKKAYRLDGALSAKLSGDGQSIVLQRKKLDIQKQEAPFWTGSAQTLIVAAENGSVDLSKLKDRLVEAGASVPSYELPKEKTAFNKTFAWDKFTVTPSFQYVMAQANLTNLSQKYFTFKTPSFEYVRCRLLDEQGKVLMESPPAQPGGQGQRLVMAPKRQSSFSCYLFVNGTIPPGTKTKFEFFLEGQEESSKLSQDVTI